MKVAPRSILVSLILMTGACNGNSDETRIVSSHRSSSYDNVPKYAPQDEPSPPQPWEEDLPKKPDSKTYQERYFVVPVDGSVIPMMVNSSGNLYIRSLPKRIQGRFNLVIDRTGIIFYNHEGDSWISQITDRMCESVKSHSKFASENKDSPYVSSMAKDRRDLVRSQNGIRIDLFPTHLNIQNTYVELARQQGIEMNSAPYVLNLPTINKIVPKVSFKENALSHFIGELSEFDQQIRRLSFNYPYTFDRYDSDLSSADLICDLRSGEAVFQLDLEISFKDLEGNIKNSVIESTMVYDNPTK